MYSNSILLSNVKPLFNERNGFGEKFITWFAIGDYPPGDSFTEGHLMSFDKLAVLTGGVFDKHLSRVRSDYG